jgi:hypothetical protein
MAFQRGTTSKAREKTVGWIASTFPQYVDYLTTGLPEYDDRFDAWRVPLHTKNSKLVLIGEVKLDRDVKKILDHTKTEIIADRVEKYKGHKGKNEKVKNKTKLFYPAPIPNKVILGSSVTAFEDFPPDTAQLVFTSPPYYNAKPEYSEYVDYKEYLDFLKKVFTQCHKVLSEGRYLIVNIYFARSY